MGFSWLKDWPKPGPTWFSAPGRWKTARRRPKTLLASNTSNFSIIDIAASTKRPQKVVGLHYFKPSAVMKLIEVVRGVETSEEALQTVLDFAKKSGKVTVVCKDSQGFVTSPAVF